MDMYNDFCSVICHYGIKRRSGRYPWGSGDDPYQSISRGSLSDHRKKMLIKKAKKKQQEAKKTPEEPSKKTISEMSEDEIRQAISRLQLEKQYADLVKSMEPKDNSSAPTRQESKGKKFISEVMYNSGKQAATYVLTESFKYAGATAINKMVGKNVVNVNVKKDEKKN